MYQSLLNAAVGAFHSGNHASCVEQCDSALVQFPNDETLPILKAMALQSLGRYTEAAEIFRGLASRRPDSPHHWSNLGLMLRHSGRLAEAREAFQRSLALAPRAYDALINYGLLLLDMNRLGEARHRFLDALEVDPQSAEAGIYAAATCFECGDIQRAASLIPPRETWASLDGDLRHDLAMVLINVGRIEEAERTLDPDAFGTPDPVAIARLAMLHERTNRIDSATALLDRIRHHIDDGDRDAKIDALTVDAALAMRAKDFARARASTRQLLAMQLPAPAEANAWFTLATIADKEGEPDAAMQMLGRAHSVRLQLASEIAPQLVKPGEEPLQIAMKRMRPGQCRFADDASDPGPEQSPVFIVGFPRSGTTMLEQMLDAHPRYVSMDEQPILQRCIELVESLGLEYPYQLDQLDEPALNAARAVYWNEVGKVVGLDNRQILVDKNPLNLLRLPMIRRLFPSARIILALRHPCDVLLSNYMQNFRSPAFMVLCSSLERLAGSYVNSMQSWIHHQQLLQPNVLTLRYEDTVVDFAGQVTRIAGFLGIDDQHYLAGFAQHAMRKGYISTPSYSQVIEPVDARAVSRWHPYRKYFEPVFPILGPVAGHWGYALAAD